MNNITIKNIHTNCEEDMNIEKTTSIITATLKISKFLDK